MPSRLSQRELPPILEYGTARRPGMRSDSTPRASNPISRTTTTLPGDVCRRSHPAGHNRVTTRSNHERYSTTGQSILDFGLDQERCGEIHFRRNTCGFNTAHIYHNCALIEKRPPSHTSELAHSLAMEGFRRTTSRDAMVPNDSSYISAHVWDSDSPASMIKPMRHRNRTDAQSQQQSTLWLRNSGIGGDFNPI
jgi:hypothetical protein